MRRNLTLFAACATAAALAATTGANAAVTVLTSGSFDATPDHQYALTPFTLTEDTTSSAAGTKNVPAGSSETYDFSFNIDDVYNTTAFGSFGFNRDNMQAFTDANLQLYSGIVDGTHNFITGVDYDPQIDVQQSLSSNLTPGNYFVQAKVTTATGGSSSPITLSATVHHISAAPEPSTWLLMMMGVGALGMGLRYQRRQGLALTA